MSDSKQAIETTLAVLIPTKLSGEVKQILISEGLYQNKFRPQTFGDKLALPITGNIDGLIEQLLLSIPLLDGQLSISECLLDSNPTQKTPSQMMISNILKWLEKNNLSSHKNTLVELIPKKWELLGDLALLPSSAFCQKEWTNILTKFNDEEIDSLWSTVCQSLNVNRLGRQQKISKDEMRTSQVELLHGSNGWVELIDYGIHFGFDATKVMYSSGNVTERHRIGNIDMEGEIIVDAFAGIGYYTLPMLIRSQAKHVHACELNPDSIEALTWAVNKNQVVEKITIHSGDNKISLPKLEGCADRCHLGILPSSEEVWNLALKCLKPLGGWLHIHMNVIEENIANWVEQTIKDLEILSNKIGRNWNIEAKHLEKVKWYAPHIRHVVLDVLCS